MNFLLAWVLASIVLMIGAPEPRETVSEHATILSTIGVQINFVDPESPAQEAGLKPGDVVDEVCYEDECTEITGAEQLRETILSYQGKEVDIHITRGKEELVVSGTPRSELEEGQGALGISMSETVLVRYSFFYAIWEGLMRVIGWTWLILGAMGALIGGMFSALFGGEGVNMDGMAGPVGIAVMTKDMQELGMVYLLQFMAILSVNLGIINIMPVPALDGGRIMFLGIDAIAEKIMKVKKVSKETKEKVNKKIQKSEHILNAFFFVLLICFMLWITFADVMKYI
jgi:regulator of sigma E protease